MIIKIEKTEGMSNSMNDHINIAVIDDEADLLDMYKYELIDFGFDPATFCKPMDGYCAPII